MAVGELVFANVIDQRVLDAQGPDGPAGVYLLGVPGRALPFSVFRAWKVPTGTVSEEIQFWSPSGELVHQWGPVARRMLGSMDLTRELDLLEDVTFSDSGAHLASFVIDGEVVSELEFPVFVQEAATKLPKEVEDGLKRSDVIWVGVERDGDRVTIPAWFAYKNGRILVLSQREPGPEEQTIPGVPGSPEVVVVTRRKGRDTSLDEFHAAVRLLEGPEWETAAAALADRRRSRVGSSAERIQRWRQTAAIAELTPVL
jgi:hypothetical protein